MIHTFALCLAIIVAGAPAVTPKPAPLGEPDEHVAYWMKTLETHPTPLIRKNAARALGSLKDPRSVATLIKALSDTDPSVRGESARSLGYLGNEDSIKPLEVSASRDPDPRVRRSSKEASERIKAYLEFQKKKQEKADKAEKAKR